jgi:hypothetical protein
MFHRNKFLRFGETVGTGFKPAPAVNLASQQPSVIAGLPLMRQKFLKSEQLN